MGTHRTLSAPKEENQVVLQKLVKDRKIPGKGIGYAATPKISAMKRTRLFPNGPFLYASCYNGGNLRNALAQLFQFVLGASGS